MRYLTGIRLSVNYSIQIKSSAAKELARISKPDRQRIVSAIDGLSANPHSGSVLKGELRGLRRIRIGSYRVVYEVMDDQLLILVLRISHRRDVYRR